MRLFKRICFVANILVPIWTGCIPSIPQSEYPTEIKKEYNSSLDKIWNSVLEVVRMSNGTAITIDKASNIIAYTIPIESDLKIYINIYLRINSANKTTVFFFSRIKSKSSFLEANFKHTDKEFFEKLDKLLERI